MRLCRSNAKVARTQVASEIHHRVVRDVLFTSDLIGVGFEVVSREGVGCLLARLY